MTGLSVIFDLLKSRFGKNPKAGKYKFLVYTIYLKYVSYNDLIKSFRIETDFGPMYKVIEESLLRDRIYIDPYHNTHDMKSVILSDNLQYMQKFMKDHRLKEFRNGKKV